MNIPTPTFSPAAADCDAVRIVVAIELSRKSWLVGMLTPLADKISLHQLPAGDGTALLELLDPFGAAVPPTS